MRIKIKLFKKFSAAFHTEVLGFASGFAFMSHHYGACLSEDHSRSSKYFNHCGPCGLEILVLARYLLLCSFQLARNVFSGFIPFRPLLQELILDICSY